MDCRICNVRPAVAYDIPTQFGLADLCNHCLPEVKRRRATQHAIAEHRWQKPGEDLPPGRDGQQQFLFLFETKSGGPVKTARPQ